MNLISYCASACHGVFGFDQPQVDDSIAGADVLDPAVVRTVAASVTVELTGTYTRGATGVDLHRRTGRVPNADVAVDLDVNAFWRMLMTAVRRVGAAPSPSIPR